LFPITGCLNDDGYPPLTTLTGYDDWSGLNLHFRESSGFADGISSLDPLSGESQGNMEFKSAELPVIGERPVAIAGDEFGAADQLTYDEGEILLLTSWSTDDGTIDASPTAQPPGVMWDIDNNTLYDDAGIDAWGNSSPIFLDDDDGGVPIDDGTGSFTVGLKVNDDDGNTSDPDDYLEIIIANVAPSVEAGSNQTINEGDSINLDPATFTDQGIFDTHTFSIDWGDGTSDSGALVTTSGVAPVYNSTTKTIDDPLIPSSGTVSGSHTFAQDGEKTVIVSVTDKDSGVGDDTLTVTVNNVAPTFLSVSENQTIVIGDELGTLSASFTDPGIEDTWDVLFDWGDGTSETSLDVPLGDIAFPVHDFGIGQYDITITVSDRDGGSSTAVIGITVGLGFDGDSPILSPIDNSQVKQGRNLPVNISFEDSQGVSVGPPNYDALKIGVWVDDITDGIGNELEAKSTKKNVKDNIADWNRSSQQYEFSLSTDTLNTGIDGAPHLIIIKVLQVIDGIDVPFLTFNQTMTIKP
jgi:hypothetical protein